MLVALQHVLVAFCHVKIQPWEFEKTVVGRRSMAWAQKLQDRCVECLWMNKTEISYIICKYNIYIYLYLYIPIRYICIYIFHLICVNVFSPIVILICIDMYWYELICETSKMAGAWAGELGAAAASTTGTTASKCPTGAESNGWSQVCGSFFFEAFKNSWGLDDWKVKMWIINDYILVGVFLEWNWWWNDYIKYDECWVYHISLYLMVFQIRPLVCQLCEEKPWFQSGNTALWCVAGQWEAKCWWRLYLPCWYFGRGL